MNSPAFSSLVRALPRTIPFVAPEEIERRTDQRFKARLGANENAWGTSPKVRAALGDVNWAHYPDPKCFELKNVLGEILGADPSQLLVAGGIDELLGLVARAFTDPGDSIVTSLGTYPTLEYHARGHGARLVRVPYANKSPDLEQLGRAAHREHAKIVYLANPDNPSGAYHERESIRSFRSALPSDCLLLLDEAYIEFAPETGPLIEPARADLLRLRTFSKVHGLAGLRIGYAIGEPEVISAFDKIRLHFGVTLAAQRAAIAALADPAFTGMVLEKTAQGREEYQQLARSLGLEALVSATNFVNFDFGSERLSVRVVQALEREGVFVRRPSAVPLSSCIRVTVGSATERKVFADALRRVLHREMLDKPH